MKRLARFVAPGGHLHIYLYRMPEIRWHRGVLRLVSAARQRTVKKAHWLPQALLSACGCPVDRRRPALLLPAACARTRRLANLLPLKTYADYPFMVLVDDQFDRFSAPIVRRFTRAQVQTMLEQGGLEHVVTLPITAGSGTGADPAQ